MLYLVATPIGNLGDITLRALETLKSVDLVVSEDTRKTGFLLKHFEIRQPQMSFHEYNEEKAAARVVGLLLEGKNVALVSDAGSPSVSDPGYRLVRAALDAGVEITAIPGPTAVITALVLSGLPVHSFTFRGFPPRKSSARRKYLAVDEQSPHTLIFYESPFRLGEFLKDCLAVYGDRPAVIANDLTKKFELLIRGNLSELVEKSATMDKRGEFTVVIAGNEANR
ncbi:MAG: 16S rRNA (cytidine(1402)-2'-O)-methyltransferase [Leptolinea sp.]|jgi:16S rRNA (cytidine1402-2'-O)-methyltransferase|nr:16S rRNA (cytidine(1402)-2'-O)-methyltransferase [Leptolinea sp.]